LFIFLLVFSWWSAARDRVNSKRGTHVLHRRKTNKRAPLCYVTKKEIHLLLSFWKCVKTSIKQTFKWSAKCTKTGLYR
jgi:hypothetical protein